MQRLITGSLFFFYCLIGLPPADLHADLDNNLVIDHEIAQRVETLKEKNGYSSEDFNACQITWSTRALEKTDPHSQFTPHEITFQYEDQDIIKLVNSKDDAVESIQGLGLNCLEFNNHVYLFFDTSNYETRIKFDLTDLAYIVYSADKGASWTQLQSLDQFSVKDKFILPSERFQKYVKIFGNDRDHALTIFNLRDETTYLFDPEFEILKTVPVYNRLSDFNYPTDFHYFRNKLYLVRGSCEITKKGIHCPGYTYLETSRDFGRNWNKEKLPFLKKSYFLTLNKTLYHFYFKSCRGRDWFGLIPGLDRSIICGEIQVKKLNILGQWEKPRTIIKTAAALLGIYYDTKPILVWRDYRFHKSRACGYVPLIGCVDSTPFRGPNVIYAGELDLSDWKIKESLIEYKQ